MSDWVHELPVAWMAVVVFGCTFIITAVIYTTVMRLAANGCGRSFKAVSPGLLPPLGIIFGLFVAFTAAQVWNDNERAQTAVNREASALRTVLVISASFSGDTESRIRTLIRDHIEETTTKEWPLMAQRSASLSFTPPALAKALQLTLAIAPVSEGQKNGSAGNRDSARKRVRCTSAANTDQPIASQFGKVVMPVFAGGLRAICYRYGA